MENMEKDRRSRELVANSVQDMVQLMKDEKKSKGEKEMDKNPFVVCNQFLHVLEKSKCLGLSVNKKKVANSLNFDFDSFGIQLDDTD